MMAELSRKEMLERIVKNVSTNPAAAEEALRRLQFLHMSPSKADRFQGFYSGDAQILGALAVRVLHGVPLSDWQLQIAFKRLPRYAEQLLDYGDDDSGAPDRLWYKVPYESDDKKAGPRSFIWKPFADPDFSKWSRSDWGYADLPAEPEVEEEEGVWI